MIIEYTELSRESLAHGGYRIVGRFKDADPSGNVDATHRFYVDSEYPAEVMVTAKVDALLVQAHYLVNPLNSFDLGVGDEQPVVNSAVVYVRANPAITFPALVIAVDTSNPNMLWKADKFLSEMHQYLEQEMERTYTFEESKQFMIDEKFEDLD